MLFDINGYSDEELYNVSNLVSAVFLLDQEMNEEELIRRLRKLIYILILIQDSELEKKYQNYKKEKGGALKMTLDQIRELYYKQKGREEEREKKSRERKNRENKESIKKRI